MTVHAARFRRRLLGYRPWGRKAGIYGTTVRCSCGWERKTNDDRRGARELWRVHVEQVGAARFGFGPERVK